MQDQKAARPKVGAHLSIGKGLEVTAKNAVAMEVETFQVFLRNPRGSGFRVWKNSEVQQFKEIIGLHNIAPVVAHIPYIVNPASSRDDLYKLAQRVITEDMERCDIIDVDYLVLHPGSRGDSINEEAIERLINLLNDILVEYEGEAMMLIETMSGMGKEICSNFDEMKMLWQGIKNKERLGICFDTCHLLAAGYDMATVEGISGVLDEWDRKIGVEHIKVVHANDSQRELGTHIDRHASIGTGHIGIEGFTNLMKNPILRELPFIIETPTIEEDIQTLRKIRATLQT